MNAAPPRQTKVCIPTANTGRGAVRASAAPKSVAQCSPPQAWHSGWSTDFSLRHGGRFLPALLIPRKPATHTWPVFTCTRKRRARVMNAAPPRQTKVCTPAANRERAGISALERRWDTTDGENLVHPGSWCSGSFQQRGSSCEQELPRAWMARLEYRL